MYELIAWVAPISVVAVVCGWLWWELHRESQPERADCDVARLADRAEGQGQVAEEGPPPAQATRDPSSLWWMPPTTPELAQMLAGRPPAEAYPPGVGLTTPVWLANSQQGVKAHRLDGDGYFTPEGFVIVVEPGRKLGVTLPAGMARATRNVQFCRTCWPVVPVIPGPALPRRRPTS